MVPTVACGNGGASWVVKIRDAGLEVEETLRPVS
jgi:hypothetical protein